MDQLKAIPITGKNQLRPISLDKVAGVSRANEGVTEFNRVNMKRVINIYMDAQDRDIGGVAEDAKKIIDETGFPDGYSAVIKGEISEMKKA